MSLEKTDAMVMLFCIFPLYQKYDQKKYKRGICLYPQLGLPMKLWELSILPYENVVCKCSQYLYERAGKILKII